MSDVSVRTTQLHNCLERMLAGDLAARDELLRRWQELCAGVNPFPQPSLSPDLLNTEETSP